MTYNDGLIRGIARRPSVYTEEFMSDIPDDDFQFDGIMDPVERPRPVKIACINNDDGEGGVDE